jgi:hypothetical protein
VPQIWSHAQKYFLKV